MTGTDAEEPALPATGGARQRGALEDIFVVDLSHALAGPLCSTLLADFGARVIKVETPGKGDIARKWGPPFHGDDSAYFIDLNRNKESVEIDLKHPRGKELLLKLLEKADVLVENFRVGAMERLGLDYPRLCEAFPRLVYCSISGFGQTGPYRDCGVSIADAGAGMNAAFAILAALHARQRTGRGQHLDVSMLEGQLGLLDTMIAMYRADGVVPKPMGTAYKTLLPYQTFRTATQDLAIAVGSEALWKALCALPGFERFGEDARYRTNAGRSRDRDALIPALQEIFLARPYAEWEAMLLEKGVPVGAINTLDRAAEHPQAKARGVFVEREHPVAGKVSMVAPWVRMSETPGGVRSVAPLLGQHTDEVLRDQLGLGAAEIDALRRDGAIH
jgi:crotonobetainyl-CoA:carnitine CoA-transferase CaiB-like acyl-CoA transferase